MVETIETVGEELDEKTEPQNDPVPADLRPVFSIAGAIEWSKAPENEARIRETMRGIDAETKRIADAVTGHVETAGKLLIDCLEHEDVAQALGESLLDSILGRR